MQILSILLIDVGWTVAATVIMAVAVIPLNVLTFIIWLSLLIVRYRRLHKLSVVVTQCSILILVLLGASLAPVKIVEIILDRPVVVDATAMSLIRMLGKRRCC
jgi:hypothetical protein